jgi:hypothetical protein
MIGNNELQLNEATMIEAVQFWVNANFTNPPRVQSIDMTKGGSYSKTFTVCVDGGEKKESA